MNKHLLAVSLIWLCLALTNLCFAGAQLPKASGTPVQRPEWWLSQPAQGGFVCTYGIGVGSSQELSHAAARENASEQASEFLAQYGNQLSATFQRESGLVDPRVQALMEKMVKAIASAKYPDAADGQVETKIITDKGKVRYRTWIQVLIPKSAIEQSLVNNIRYEDNLAKLFLQSKSYTAILEKIQD